MQTLAATGVLCRTMITVFHSVPGPAPATFSRPHSLIKKKSVFIIVRRLEVILGTVLRVLILRSLPDIETQSLKYWVKIFPRMIFLPVSTANISWVLLPSHHQRATDTCHRSVPFWMAVGATWKWRKFCGSKTNAFYSLENSSDNRCESSSVGLGTKGYPVGIF